MRLLQVGRAVLHRFFPGGYHRNYLVWGSVGEADEPQQCALSAPSPLVWGLGCVLLTALLYKYKDRSDRYIFLAGTVLGGAYEYSCSVFTELVFGTVFWDYSHIPFNLGDGSICCFAFSGELRPWYG